MNGTSGFGVRWVRGRSRVPLPPARISARIAPKGRPPPAQGPCSAAQRPDVRAAGPAAGSAAPLVEPADEVRLLTLLSGLVQTAEPRRAVLLVHPAARVVVRVAVAH